MWDKFQVGLGIFTAETCGLITDSWLDNVFTVAGHGPGSRHPAPVIAFEEEPEEAVGESQHLVEWQADNVVWTLGSALSYVTF